MGPEDSFFRYAERIYATRRMTNSGELVVLLEERLAEMHGVRHCITFCNACIGLMVLFEILKERSGGSRLIMPAFTYEGLPHLARWVGLYPLFCELDPVTLTLDPISVERNMSDDVVGIVGVHQVTGTGAVTELERVARDHGKPLVFDAVYGIFESCGGVPTGGFGWAEVFSLHATKLINGFEGGYITTNDDGLAQWLRRIIRFGFTATDQVSYFGINAKLNEIHAALALASLDVVGDTLSGNRARHQWYSEHFKNVPGCSILCNETDGPSNNCSVLLELGPGWVFGRDQVIALLKRERVLAAPFFSPPLHRPEHMPEGEDVPSLPVTESVARRFLSMPVGELVDEDTIRRIAGLMAFMYENQEEIAGRLAS
ncbi:MAG: DegT/DnrJ/EryC1/StrS family aminotransferase [Pseudodesulfovibrio sp.]|uniref:DegT/DnrJ/EryC1/StrS family aminotransferase n=1 Tax=Pseudodesulfovibrio sp. TaxID=2035812 RepID=UPI003D0C7EA3